MKKMLLTLASALVLSCSANFIVEAPAAGSSDARGIGQPAIVLESSVNQLINIGHVRLAHQARFSVEVENVSPVKSVIVHYTVDGVTWKDAPVQYAKSLPNNREIWETAFAWDEVDYSDYPASKFIRFALKLTAGTSTWWDNNGGKDYFMSTAGSGELYPVALLGSGNLRLAHATYGVQYPAGVVLYARAAVKNLGFTKSVNLIYTTDGWKTKRIAPMAYNKSYTSLQEEWTCSPLVGARGSADTTGIETVEFCLSYDINGVTYWDNNGGRNYTITVGYTAP